MTLEYLNGYVQRLYRDCPKPNGWNGWFFELDNGRIVNCTMKHGRDVHEDMYLTIAAEYVGTKNGRAEYRVESADVAKTREGLILYLKSDDFPGVGHTTAVNLYNKFGASVLDIIDNEPDKLKQEGFSDKIVDILIQGRLKQSLGNLLKLFNLKPSMIEKIKDKYGRRALDVIRKYPYKLLYDFEGERGFNFKNVDALALSLGTPVDSEQRVQEAVYYIVDNFLSTNGHLCCNLSDDNQLRSLMYNIRRCLNTPKVTDKMIYDAIRDHENLKIVSYPVGNQLLQYCYTASSYHDEKTASDYVRLLQKERPLFHKTRDDIILEIEDFEMMSGKQLDDVQRESVITALQNRLSIITGGPGCGKTTVVACVLFVWRRACMPKPVLSAPTGLAAKRMKDAIIENKAGYPEDEVVVKTIARRLAELKACKSSNDPEHVPTLAIIDETSMVNMADAAAILKFLGNCQIVFVGDADQLPAIDPGDFFANLCSLDCIQKQFLNTCYRAVNAQVIINNAHKIRNGERIDLLDWSNASFCMQEFQADSDNSVNYIVNQYMSYVNRGRNYSEICILSPMKKGIMGVENLNIILQDKLNPETGPVFSRGRGELVATVKGVPIEGSEYWAHITDGNKKRTTFRVGDRVLQTKNRYELGLVNGDCGIILSYHKPDKEPPYLKLKLDDGNIVDIDSNDFSDLQLAYSVTIHKSQGCEYHKVMIALPHVLVNHGAYHSDFTTRNLMYTAATRAKYEVEFVGSSALLQQCIDTVRPFRMSLFPNRIVDVCA